MGAPHGLRLPGSTFLVWATKQNSGCSNLWVVFATAGTIHALWLCPGAIETERESPKGFPLLVGCLS